MTVLRCAASLAAILLTAAPALAMIEPCYLDQMVANAVRVMQITPEEVTGPTPSGQCTLVGTVVRNFRGDIEPGTRVQTTFDCENPDMVVGGTIYWDAEAVAKAAVVELHTAPEGGPAGYGWGMMLLDAPTDQPAFPFSNLPEDGGDCH